MEETMSKNDFTPYEDMVTPNEVATFGIRIVEFIGENGEYNFRADYSGVSDSIRIQGLLSNAKSEFQELFRAQRRPTNPEE
jgi:hypothetical protein